MESPVLFFQYYQFSSVIITIKENKKDQKIARLHAIALRSNEDLLKLAELIPVYKNLPDYEVPDDRTHIGQIALACANIASFQYYVLNKIVNINHKDAMVTYITNNNRYLISILDQKKWIEHATKDGGSIVNFYNKHSCDIIHQFSLNNQ